MMFTVEPGDHWRPGDRAYCLDGFRDRSGKPVLEAGRIYRVEAVRTFDNMLSDGLTLEGIEVPPPLAGFRSGRFACIRGRELPCKQIARRTRRGWYEAYRESIDARAAHRLATGDTNVR